MNKKFYYSLLLVAWIFSGCGLFDTSKSKNYQLLSTEVAVNEQRSDEIYDAVIASFNSVSQNGLYKYGKKSEPFKTFTKDAVKVLVGNCSDGNKKCNVTIYIDKMDQNLRPLFVIPSEADVSSCPAKYLAYINSTTMLASEAIAPIYPYSYNSSALTTDLNAICSNIPQGRPDYLCRKKAIIGSVSKMSSIQVDYGSNNLFNVTLPVSDYLLNIDLNTNQQGNLVCLNKIFRPSLWGVTRNTLSLQNRKDVAVFKIVLKTVE